MPSALDLKGKRFGRLVCVTPVRAWRCRCDCGAVKVVRADSLRNGSVVSCGCKKLEGQPRHGLAHSREYSSWQNMLQRCTNPRRREFKNYGGRGITVCKRWLKFENFYADMGPRPPGTTIDRKKNDRGYSKGNCRWATRDVQNTNKRQRSAKKGGARQ